MNYLYIRVATAVGSAALLLGLLVPLAFAATLDELAVQVSAISRDVSSITATTTPEARTQILSSAASRLATVASELRVIRREETLSRISRELASTTAEVMSITATTTPEVRASILSRALQKLASFAAELRALDGGTSVYLQLGDRGTGVRALQNALKNDATIYPSGLVTGYFGPLTEAAVRTFQSRNGLTVNGTVDGATYQRLIQIYGTSVSDIGANVPLSATSSGGVSGGGKG